MNYLNLNRNLNVNSQNHFVRKMDHHHHLHRLHRYHLHPLLLINIIGYYILYFDY